MQTHSCIYRVQPPAFVKAAALCWFSGKNGRQPGRPWCDKERGLPLPDITAVTHWHWDHTFGLGRVRGGNHLRPPYK